MVRVMLVRLWGGILLFGNKRGRLRRMKGRWWELRCRWMGRGTWISVRRELDRYTYGSVWVVVLCYNASKSEGKVGCIYVNGAHMC